MSKMVSQSPPSRNASFAQTVVPATHTRPVSPSTNGNAGEELEQDPEMLPLTPPEPPSQSVKNKIFLDKVASLLWATGAFFLSTTVEIACLSYQHLRTIPCPKRSHIFQR
jgi:hypothetical protein